jgi:hypothetical protein
MKVLDVIALTNPLSFFCFSLSPPIIFH